jgi:hypothetical protein
MKRGRDRKTLRVGQKDANQKRKNNEEAKPTL